MRSVSVIAVLLGLATSACVDTPRMEEPEVESSHVRVREVPEAPVTKLDLLIVVDDTAAMARYQDRLALASDALADELDVLARNWTDLRVAVVANDGLLRRLPGSDEAFLVDSIDFAYRHEQNHPGTLRDAVKALMNVGVSNPGPSQPLEAMRHALESHSEFLRDEAVLAVVTIGATDDASPWPVADYVQWTKAATGGSWHRSLVAVSINAGTTPRLDEYRAAVFQPPMTSIDDDFGPAFQRLGARWGWGVGGCLEEALADVDPMTPGLQPDCSLHVVVDEELRPLPPCTVATDLGRAVEETSTLPAPACWSLTPDPQNCFYGPSPNYALEFHGYTNSNHPAYRFECVVGE